MENQRTGVLDWTTRLACTPFEPQAPRTVQTPVVRPQHAHRGYKLTPDAVQAIRAALTAGDPVKVIARRFGVTPVTIRNIRDRRSWTDLE